MFVQEKDTNSNNHHFGSRQNNTNNGKSRKHGSQVKIRSHQLINVSDDDTDYNKKRLVIPKTFLTKKGDLILYSSCNKSCKQEKDKKRDRATISIGDFVESVLRYKHRERKKSRSSPWEVDGILSSHNCSGITGIDGPSQRHGACVNNTEKNRRSRKSVDEYANSSRALSRERYSNTLGQRGSNYHSPTSSGSILDSGKLASSLKSVRRPYEVCGLYRRVSDWAPTSGDISLSAYGDDTWHTAAVKHVDKTLNMDDMMSAPVYNSDHISDTECSSASTTEIWHQKNEDSISAVTMVSVNVGKTETSYRASMNEVTSPDSDNETVEIKLSSDEEDIKIPNISMVFCPKKESNTANKFFDAPVELFAAEKFVDDVKSTAVTKESLQGLVVNKQQRDFNMNSNPVVYDTFYLNKKIMDDDNDNNSSILREISDNSFLKGQAVKQIHTLIASGIETDVAGDILVHNLTTNKTQSNMGSSCKHPSVKKHGSELLIINTIDSDRDQHKSGVSKETHAVDDCPVKILREREDNRSINQVYISGRHKTSDIYKDSRHHYVNEKLYPCDTRVNNGGSKHDAPTSNIDLTHDDCRNLLTIGREGGVIGVCIPTPGSITQHYEGDEIRDQSRETLRSTAVIGDHRNNLTDIALEITSPAHGHLSVYRKSNNGTQDETTVPLKSMDNTYKYAQKRLDVDAQSANDRALINTHGVVSYNEKPIVPSQDSASVVTQRRNALTRGEIRSPKVTNDAVFGDFDSRELRDLSVSAANNMPQVPDLYLPKLLPTVREISTPTMGLTMGAESSGYDRTITGNNDLFDHLNSSIFADNLKCQVHKEISRADKCKPELENSTSVAGTHMKDVYVTRDSDPANDDNSNFTSNCLSKGKYDSSSVNEISEYPRYVDETKAASINNRHHLSNPVTELQNIAPLQMLLNNEFFDASPDSVVSGKNDDTTLHTGHFSKVNFSPKVDAKLPRDKYIVKSMSSDSLTRNKNRPNLWVESNIGKHLKRCKSANVMTRPIKIVESFTTRNNESDDAGHDGDSMGEIKKEFSDWQLDHKIKTDVDININLKANRYQLPDKAGVNLNINSKQSSFCPNPEKFISEETDLMHSLRNSNKGQNRTKEKQEVHKHNGNQSNGFLSESSKMSRSSSRASVTSSEVNANWLSETATHNTHEETLINDRKKVTDFFTRPRNIHELERREGAANEIHRYEMVRRRDAAQKRRDYNSEMRSYIERLRIGQNVSRSFESSPYVSWSWINYEKPFVTGRQKNAVKVLRKKRKKGT